MEFNPSKSIYHQIAEQICCRILEGEWSQSQLPSIRELASALGVNPNTVSKSYQWLTEKEIIYSQRGLGYFLSEGARERALQQMRKEFIQRELPRLFETMRHLGIDFEELRHHFQLSIKHY